MRNEVYYFSGTGNSLAVARDIAREIGASLVSIPGALHRKYVETDAECVGLVFPSYEAHLHGVPLVVARFVARFGSLRGKYIFAVTTCGGYGSFNGLPTLVNFARLIRSRGGRVSAEYSIRLPMNTLDYGHIPVPISTDREAMFKRCQRQVLGICETVAARRKSRFRIPKRLLNLAMTPLYVTLRPLYYKELRKNAKEPADSPLKYYELIPRTDRSVFYDDRCDGCMTCAKVCPVGNIEMREGRPVWLHHCEMCLACAEWCPSKAIHHCSRPKGREYHHPEVSLSDMLTQARALE